MNTTLSPTSDRVKLALSGALALACFMGFGRFSFTPILPGMMADLHLSASQAGSIAAANFTGYLAGALLASGRWAAGRERQVVIAALLATAVLLAAMGAVSSLPAFLVIRFLAGLASAFGLVFTSSIVLSAAGNDTAVQAGHFGGVGIGISLSALVSFIAVTLSGGVDVPWRVEWLIGGAIVLLAGFGVIGLLPRLKPAEGGPVAEPPLVWSAPMILITLSYLLFGFGYVVAATFLVVMARTSASGPLVEFLCWLITGVAAMGSLLAWRPALRRFGPETTYRISLSVEALGSAAMVLLPALVAPLIGGLLFGATFVVVTAYALTIGRLLSPKSPRRVIGIMTAGFGIGQIAGPVVAGYIVDHTGSYVAASLLAAAMLALGAAIAPSGGKD